MLQVDENTNNKNKMPEVFEEPACSEKARKRQERRDRKNAKKAGYKPGIIEPRTMAQADLLDSLNTATQIFAIGSAGTGKTYIPSRIALQRLKTRQIEKIYITRPTVAQVQHRQGFLPGKLEQKLTPWFAPILDAFRVEVSSAEVDKLIREKTIEFASFEHMRGRTFSNSFVILDEAQNCSLQDLKMFLTRKGEETTYVVTGDTSQSDIPDSGLATVLKIIEKHDLDADIIEFTENDVVRSEHAAQWVKAFSAWSAMS